MNEEFIQNNEMLCPCGEGEGCPLVTPEKPLKGMNGPGEYQKHKVYIVLPTRFPNSRNFGK